jgi:hypothetical protein
MPDLIQTYIAVLDGLDPPDWLLWGRRCHTVKHIVESVTPDLTPEEQEYDRHRLTLITDPPELLFKRTPSEFSLFVGVLVDGTLAADPNGREELLEKFAKVCVRIRTSKDPLYRKLGIFPVFVAVKHPPTLAENKLRSLLNEKTCTVLGLPRYPEMVQFTYQKDGSSADDLLEHWAISLRATMREMNRKYLEYSESARSPSAITG